MKRSVIGWVAVAFLAVGGAAAGYVWFAGGSGEPSIALTTPTIASNTAEGFRPTIASDTTVGSTAANGSGGAQSFVIDASGSEAFFLIDEVLRGTPQTVKGATSEVAGLFQADLSDLGTMQFSQILINARTFSTDSSFRDRAIRGPVILDSASDEFELITLDSISVSGLSGPAVVGEEVIFAISGDLTVKGLTKQVTFDVAATLVDDSTIEGTASAVIMREDFGIGIPSVPGVANVSEEVTITLVFVATSD